MRPINHLSFESFAKSNSVMIARSNQLVAKEADLEYVAAINATIVYQGISPVAYIAHY